MSYAHELEFKVRDYECDMQSVVNNGVYQNYLEHARHEFLHSRGVDFAALSAAGVKLVVVRAELDYRSPLVSSDRFVIRSRLQQISRLRFAFLQDLFRLPDERLMLAAKITGTSLNSKGRPFQPEFLAQLVDQDQDSSEIASRV